MSNKKLTKTVTGIFEQIKRIDENGNEFWSARDFAKVLEYVEYRNFIPVLNRAKEACKNSGQKIDYHFVDMHELIIAGKKSTLKRYNRQTIAPARVRRKIGSHRSKFL